MKIVDKNKYLVKKTQKQKIVEIIDWTENQLKKINAKTNRNVISNQKKRRKSCRSLMISMTENIL